MPSPERPFTLIAGPCAAESQNQIHQTAEFLNSLKPELTHPVILIMRASLFKPRTRPSWDGVKDKGIPWLIEAADTHKLQVATEVLLPDHLDDIIQAWHQLGQPPIQLIPWIGARNQNHLITQKIAHIVANHPDLFPSLIIKNPPWPDANHWIGAAEHALSTLLPRERLMLCFRGFAPHPLASNPNGLRNLPIWKIVQQVKLQLPDIPILVDPSHIAGSAEKVTSIAQTALQLQTSKGQPLFDGLMVEVHPHPASAKTDANQQLNFDQFYDLLCQLQLIAC